MGLCCRWKGCVYGTEKGENWRCCYRIPVSVVFFICRFLDDGKGNERPVLVLLMRMRGVRGEGKG
jgi:hypothetical protein